MVHERRLYRRRSLVWLGMGPLGLGWLGPLGLGTRLVR